MDAGQKNDETQGRYEREYRRFLEQETLFAKQQEVLLVDPYSDHPFEGVTHPDKVAFLCAYAQTFRKDVACKIAGISRFTPYTPSWRDDEAFQSGMELAEEIAADMADDLYKHRALHGLIEPVGWYKGEPGGYVRRPDTDALHKLLKATKSGYAEKIQFQGILAKLDMTKLPDEVIERLAAGEHPAAVFSQLSPALLQGAVADKQEAVE